MSEEIQQAVQIIRVAYDGIEIAMKVGSGTVEQMKKAEHFLNAKLDQQKTNPNTNNPKPPNTPPKQPKRNERDYLP